MQEMEKALAGLEREAPMAMEVLCMAAFLGDAPLPAEFGLNVEGGMHSPALLNPAAAMFAVAATLDPLFNAGLAEQDPETLSFFVGQEVREAVKKAVPEAAHAQWKERACYVLNLCLPDAETGNWPAAEPLMPHVTACLDHVRNGLCSASANRLLHQTGFFLFQQERCELAVEMLEAALAVDVALKGEAHPDIASDHEGLGMVNLAGGRVAEAEGHYRRCIDLRGEIFTQDNPMLAPAHDGLAHALLAAGDSAGAVQQWDEAARIMARAAGGEHPFVVQCRENADRYR
ncbi:tetratricopeptide repeat protein [Pseudodesulfovibrio senegalensis]|uniref:Tetratricopeptide repeat protein n=1 Tax=Pseudodesulfovibrio senegalensis TaxID=1721087 RepID=A0A6N6N1B3_9BACT|nr:tetratricopeptide repeat protein [Pseudodesulfovibrio senegalensis]KAB1441684.1 tetratricopeptide repeat protein [Pseudodesulfovibrio senegalensis]